MIYLLLLLSISFAAAQQTFNSTRSKVRAYRQVNEYKIVDELFAALMTMR